VTEGEIIAIDGKQARRSYDKPSRKSAIHMVSAWASHNGIVFGQQKTANKSNEITAIPKLLKLLEIKGCIITIDAMGCQKEIAAQIHEIINLNWPQCVILFWEYIFNCVWRV